MKKTMMILMLGLAAFVFSYTSPAKAVGLKEHSLIESEQITLGDIFYDLPSNSERVLGNAPRPGQEMVLNARTLLRIAVAMDLSWRPTSNSEKIVLKRAASIVEYPQVKEAINTALYEEGVAGRYEISVPAAYETIILPPHVPATLEISDMSVNARRDQFTAMVSAPSIENPIQRFEISGVITPVIEIPVLKRNVKYGDVITEADIEMMHINEQDYAQDTVSRADDLVGMTARRLLVAHRPLRQSDVIAHQIVERGSLVILSLLDGMMNISTQAKALESGAKGDIIRVNNTSSNTTIYAKVIGANQVAVVQR